MNHRRVVLLGTGTDVGKTYVASYLSEAWTKKYGPCLALKPVESGVPEGENQGSVPTTGDAARLNEAATKSLPPRHSLIAPISPHLAARQEGLTLQVPDLVKWVEEEEQNFIDEFGGEDGLTPVLSVVETAGGAYSPLSELATNVDFARGLDPALWILVAADALGTLHDIQAACRALPRRPDLLVLSEARDEDASTGTNAAEVERVVLPQLGSLAPRSSEIVTLDRNGESPRLVELIAELSED